MKRLLALIMILGNTFCTFSQTFEYQYSGYFGKIYQVAENEYLFGIYNDSVKKVHVYTLDHQLIKSFTMPSGELSYGIMHLSMTLFNNDPKLELLYSFQDNQAGSFGVRVVNEDDVVLFDEPDFYGVSFFNTSDGAKMLLDGIVPPYKVNVYSLAGIVLEPEEISVNADSQVFPNPSNGHLNIEFDVPSTESDLILSVYTMQGILVDQWNVDNSLRNIQIDVSRLPSGIYLYRIHNFSYSTITKRFVIKK